MVIEFMVGPSRELTDRFGMNRQIYTLDGKVEVFEFTEPPLKLRGCDWPEPPYVV
jgi:hypothetical protein